MPMMDVPQMNKKLKELKKIAKNATGVRKDPAIKKVKSMEAKIKKARSMKAKEGAKGRKKMAKAGVSCDRKRVEAALKGWKTRRKLHGKSGCKNK
ncbi:hypothetical protein GR7B_00125 [Vibrio phage vB_VcorM_GR7B]|nr:hypothetical protein GR7B_00125 [Vibrio phage vB_VcorM_GR7B]